MPKPALVSKLKSLRKKVKETSPQKALTIALKNQPERIQKLAHETLKDAEAVLEGDA